MHNNYVYTGKSVTCEIKENTSDKHAEYRVVRRWNYALDQHMASMLSRGDKLIKA